MKEIWYKDFFDRFYIKSYKYFYSREITKKQVDFIEKSLKLPKGAQILDLCCGYGRHCIELAKRGYQMIGQDLSKYFLKIARKESEKQGLKIQFILNDMRKIPFYKKFDAVINLNTSFGYLESDRENNRVVRQIAKALKPEGKFFLDLRSKNWIVNNFQRKDWRIIDDLIILEERTMNPLKVKTKVIYIEGGKIKKRTEHYARLYSFLELKKMLKNEGLKIREVYGNFNFEKYSNQSERIIIISQKLKNF